MTILDSASFLIGFTGGLSLLLCLGEIVVKEKTTQTYIQATLFFLAAIFQLHTYFVGYGNYVGFPHLYLLHLPFTALFGSMLARYFSIFITEGKIQLKLKVYELLPPILVILCLFPFYMSSAEEKRQLFMNYLNLGVPIRVKLAITVAVLPIFIAAYFIFSRILRYLRWQTVKDSPHLKLVLYIIVTVTIASIVGLVTVFFHDRHGLKIVSLIISFLLIFVYLIRQRNPELIREVTKIVLEEKKYQITQLKSVDLRALGEKLNHLMSVERYYRNDDIGLADLAKELSVSQHQLSEYLNGHLGKNFFQVINAFRIKEAKELCHSAPEKTILSIAYEVGFPSKSTFYDAFKKETGMSPTEFRKLKRPNG
ncbi:MAG: helix-turn-helix domain-containing protein [Leptospira sp.]|nr:helix-turn-helix domain-containing protein [Leptospira sp.]